MSGPGSAIALPPPLQRGLDSFAARIMAPAGGPGFDFATPRGEPASIAADSVSWRVFRNPVQACRCLGLPDDCLWSGRR